MLLHKEGLKARTVPCRKFKTDEAAISSPQKAMESSRPPFKNTGAMPFNKNPTITDGILITKSHFRREKMTNFIFKRKREGY
jgi:hypothetical protein